MQTSLEGEPTSKTPRVPPALSPGINVPHQGEDPKAVSAMPAAAKPAALQLDAFVNDFVKSIVSKVKSELVAEAQCTAPHDTSRAGAASLPPTLLFTEGKSAANVSPHKGRSAAARPLSHRPQHSVGQLPHKTHSAADADQNCSSVQVMSGWNAAVQPELPQIQPEPPQPEPHSPQPQPELHRSEAEVPQTHPSQALAAESGKQTWEVSTAAATVAGRQLAGPSTATTADSQAGQAGTAAESRTEQPGTEEVVHDLVQGLLEAVIRHAQPEQVTATASAFLQLRCNAVLAIRTASSVRYMKCGLC